MSTADGYVRDASESDAAACAAIYGPNVRGHGDQLRDGTSDAGRDGAAHHCSPWRPRRPAVALNRAVALAEVAGPEPALAEVDALILST